MKTTLVIVALVLGGCLVGCDNTSDSTETEAGVCDTTAVGHIDSIECVTMTNCISITDVSVTADSVE